VSAELERLRSIIADLLEALQAMRVEYGDHADTAVTLEAVRLADAAIARAMGDEP
jgi:hypothetical protein